MIRIALLLITFFLGGSMMCEAQSTETYALVVPSSASTAGSGCACDGVCGLPDSTWVSTGSYASLNGSSIAATIRRASDLARRIQRHTGW